MKAHHLLFFYLITAVLRNQRITEKSECDQFNGTSFKAKMLTL